MAKREKTGGRTKGTPNKATLRTNDIAERLDVDPFEVLLRFAANDHDGLGYDKTRTVVTKNGEFEVDTISPELRQKAAKDACEYLYPKRRSVDSSGKEDNLAETFEQFLTRISGKS